MRIGSEGERGGASELKRVGDCSSRILVNWVNVADKGGYRAEAEVEANEGREKEGTGG